MSDTEAKRERDKHEGHTPGPLRVRRHYDNDLWCVADEKDYLVMQTPFPDECSPAMTDDDHYANAQLMAAAPLLLQEVKRLREGIKDAIYLFQMAGNPNMTDKKRLEIICDFLLEMIE